MEETARELSFTPRSRAERRRARATVDPKLDASQRAAVELPASRPLLVLGEAGYGKTTVLVHRVARLARASTRAARVLVVVPSAGLAQSIESMLRRLGADANVWTIDELAERQARRVFRRLPRISDTTPLAVSRFKRSPALASAIRERAAHAPAVIDDARDAELRPNRAHATRGDLQQLFGDREVVERVAREGALSQRDAEAVLGRTRVQFAETTEVAWSHVIDPERLVAVDGLALDEGTTTDHATTLDPEDCAVLLSIDSMRSLRRGARPTPLRTFDLVAIDEAQELAPIELSVIARSLAPGATLIVAGDADQQTSDSATFAGWDAVMSALGACDHLTAKLAIGYRCAPEVVALARAVRDRTASAHGVRVTVSRTMPRSRKH